jgi:hypothetical protein
MPLSRRREVTGGLPLGEIVNKLFQLKSNQIKSKYVFVTEEALAGSLPLEAIISNPI